MANLTYHVIPHRMKDIAADPMLINAAEETDTEDLNTNGSYDEDSSVMTLCDNFITIYGYKTWKKKFGGR